LQYAYTAAPRAPRICTKLMRCKIKVLLDAIRDWFLKDQEERYFNHTVMECVDVMDLEDIETLMRQYLERYGRHLDGNNMPSAKYLVPRYREVVRAHAQVVRNIRTHFSR